MLTTHDRLDWIIPSTHPVLRKGEVHVWQCSLEVSSSCFSELRTALSPTEAARAHSYHEQEERGRFTISRALLKKILAGYLNVDPYEVQFAYSDDGKPELSSSNSWLRFSKSSTHHVALFAVARDCDVGIDVERIGVDCGVESIADCVFTPEERFVLKSSPAAAKQEHFFSCWTRKEAIAKALGCGLSIPWQQFPVFLRPRVPAQSLGARNTDMAVQEWSLIDLPMTDEYTGALAVRMTAPIISFWDATAL